MEKPPLSEILRPEGVAVGIDLTDRVEVLRMLIGLLPLEAGLGEAVLKSVLEREEVQTTGIGYGIAIPHGKAEIGLPIVGAVGITSGPVDYGSVDGEPVRIFILMVSRPDVTGPHIHALAQAARLLGHQAFRAALLSCSTPDEVVELIRSEEERTAP